MTVQWSTTLRNALLDQWEIVIGTSPKLQVRSGTAPGSCAAGPAGTLLAEFILSTDWATNATGGSKTIAGLPLDTFGVNPGTAQHYRIYDSTGTVCHEQGTITVSGGGGDATIDNPAITTGQTVTLTAYSKTAPGA